MIIIIDGYNILRQSGSPVAEKYKTQFIKKVGRYAKEKKHTVILVFDGGPTAYSTKEYDEGITIIHSGYKQTADDYIKELLAKEKGKDILLASSDGELTRFAHQLTIPSIDADAFNRFLNQEEEAPQATKRTELQKYEHASEDEELAALMEEMTRKMPTKHEDLSSQGVRKKSEALSKREKKLHKKIKKL